MDNSQTKTLVTIAIPFYNAERFMALAIDSVINQTYKHWILLLIDDGSTDSSLTIAKDYEKKDNRIKVFSDGENKNLGYRLNQIANIVDTKYLARMDADDIMVPDRIEKQLEILEINTEIDVLGTNAYSINENNLVEGIRNATNLDNPILMDCSVFIHPTIMAKTEWFIANPYDVKALRVEDYELWNRTFENSTFKLYSEPLLYYREFGFDYYKKYLKGIKPLLYIANKNKKISDYIVVFKRCFKTLIYFSFSVLGKENILIQKRYVKLNNQDKNNAQKYVNIISKKNEK